MSGYALAATGTGFGLRTHFGAARRVIAKECVALDASALLTYLQGEPGADVVAEAIADGALMSAVNLAEVLSKRSDAGDDPTTLARRLLDTGLLGGAIEVVGIGFDEAVGVADLRSATGVTWLSIGDRACLALARQRSIPALTADSAWTDLDLGVAVRLIR